ncbi:hypothetical protein AcW1_005699 [Taiwanofungus camphoratus]|nr:hypothetical protein AcW1_005699 [Antrodia cinnamomea]
MLGVEGYGSDNGSDTEAQFTPSISSTASLTTKLAPSPKKSTFSLPPPTNAPAAPSSASTPFSGLSLPAPKTRRAPKKITIGLPELPPETSKGDDVDARRVAKKPRLESLESKARSSALLSMLPAPKNTAPVTITQERVLGGGRGPGLVFNTTASRSSRTSTVEDVEDAKEEGDATEHAETANPVKNVPIPFLPPSLVKGKANISVEETNDRPQTLVHAPSSAPAVDFFSIGKTGLRFIHCLLPELIVNVGSSNSDLLTSSRSDKASLSKHAAVPSASPVSTSSVPPPASSAVPGVSSAPKVDDFVPPEPTPQDQYPGYYLLPSGAWAAYDPQYYRSFYDKWKREYDAHVRALEKGTAKGFEDLETEGAQEVDALREMEKAKKEIQEREEKKALTTGNADAAAAPKMNIKGAALGGRARTRHQLSTLLTEAYQNREALEEKIALGRRNRKEAGNKYGF